MADVDPAEARSMLCTFLANAQAQEDRLKRMPPWRRLFASPAPMLGQELNQLVEYLSNSPDIYTIKLLNQYPFKPTTRRLPGIIDTTRSLIGRLPDENPEAEENTIDNEPGHTT